MHLLDLHGHSLVVRHQGSFIILVHSDLLDEVLGCGPLLPLLLTQGEPFVRLDEFAFSIDDHSLELVPLPHKLLAICVDLLLQMQVLFQEGVPLALALSFASLVLLNQTSQLAELLRLCLKNV